jgi:arabinogalactan oligomer/maltooligosaccharide transport system substrate-binding protein
VVANVAAYDDPAIGGDPVIATFRAQAALAVPMPKSAQMNAVWTPYEVALKEILRGGDPGDALRGAQREVVEGP